MTSVVRRCMNCHEVDATSQWSSMDEAAERGALRSGWACPKCAWPEAELVEMDRVPVATAAATTSAPPSPGATVSRTDLESMDRPDQAVQGSDPFQPTDPDEARRAASTAARIAR